MIFPPQGSNPCPLHFLHWQEGSLPLVLSEKPTHTHTYIQHTHTYTQSISWDQFFRQYNKLTGLIFLTKFFFSFKNSNCYCKKVKPRQHVKKQRHYFVNKGPSSQGYSFSSGHVWMWELDCEESSALKNWCFWTVVLEKTLESPLDYKEIQPVHPKRKSVLSVHWKDWCWSWNSNILATWCEELTHLKRPWCWARLKAGGDGDDRGWDG